jgi:RNA polymerase sigma-70 factor (ECF subfamily)
LNKSHKGTRKPSRSYAGLSRAVISRALNILGNAETADEVVQDGLLAWKGSKNFNGGSRPFSWMWSIVRNKATDALRNSTRPEEFKARHDDDGAAKEPEQDAVICQALEKLSPEHRLAIILTYYLNLSQTQISQIMQCPLGTVKSRLSNALKQVRNSGTMLIFR